MIDSDLEKVQDFISGHQKNAWLDFGPMEIYVRKSTRSFRETGIVYCFDIANINIIDAEQGKGRFTGFLTSMKDIARKNGFDVIFIESVINKKFAEKIAAMPDSIDVSLHPFECNFIFKLK